jgi:AcrR family transcriptional regulator
MADNGPPRRRQGLRRDAEANRERLLAAALTAMLREGRNVPLAAIAAEAGVGVGTLYRKYPDRAGLMRALEHRAYGLLNDILDDIEEQAAGHNWAGIRCIEEYLIRRTTPHRRHRPRRPSRHQPASGRLHRERCRRRHDSP